MKNLKTNQLKFALLGLLAINSGPHLVSQAKTVISPATQFVASLTNQLEGSRQLSSTSTETASTTKMKDILFSSSNREVSELNSEYVEAVKKSVSLDTLRKGTGISSLSRTDLIRLQREYNTDKNTSARIDGDTLIVTQFRPKANLTKKINVKGKSYDVELQVKVEKNNSAKGDFFGSDGYKVSVEAKTTGQFCIDCEDPIEFTSTKMSEDLYDLGNLTAAIRQTTERANNELVDKAERNYNANAKEIKAKRDKLIAQEEKVCAHLDNGSETQLECLADRLDSETYKGKSLTRSELSKVKKQIRKNVRELVRDEDVDLSDVMDLFEEHDRDVRRLVKKSAQQELDELAKAEEEERIEERTEIQETRLYSFLDRNESRINTIMNRAEDYNKFLQQGNTRLSNIQSQCRSVSGNSNMFGNSQMGGPFDSFTQMSQTSSQFMPQQNNQLSMQIARQNCEMNLQRQAQWMNWQANQRKSQIEPVIQQMQWDYSYLDLDSIYPSSFRDGYYNSQRTEAQNLVNNHLNSINRIEEMIMFRQGMGPTMNSTNPVTNNRVQGVTNTNRTRVPVARTSRTSRI
ncbi:MAG: hypothetical protein AB8E15_06575 [Bdellovibrionales bacterium]